MRPRHSIASIVLAAAAVCTPVAPVDAFDTHRLIVEQFVTRMVENHAFDEAALRKLLKAAHSQPSIIAAMDRPAEKAKSWFEYRSIFLTEKRIQGGADFWLVHRSELDQASIHSGVEPEYLVAILGVETYYGRLMGNYRILDALATLGFDYPARSKFFLDELEQFLLLSREATIDPLEARGSYAGAMGAPQFMPSNYRRYAIDASADGHIDLWKNWPDVLASVGNFFKEHGWILGEPVLAEAAVNPDKAKELDGRKLSLAQTVGALKIQGVNFDSTLPDDSPAMLIAVDEANATHWRVGYKNFYVITRYNHSTLYAMAVYDLATAIKQRILAHDAPT